MENSDTYISRYYSNQSDLRGIANARDVEILEERDSDIYDRLLTPHLETRKFQKIVEVGCGPGIFLRHLQKRGFVDVTGVDLSERYLEICKDQSLNVIKADALEWLASQSSSSIDVIIAIDFIEHLNKESFVFFLDLVYKVLTPNGIFIFRGPCGDSPFSGLNYSNDITHETLFTTTALNALIKMCKMEVIQFKDEYPLNISKNRWCRVPMGRFVRTMIRTIIFWSTGHWISILGPTMWVIGKPQKSKLSDKS
ncbi:Methyltransferase type 12 [Methanosarcina lacustris Z-7289]|uniref:Methyltransferase type 12 n=2 Tax=Methanosarcina lacustris TaxID=170861 RepID=A0A0E3WSZ1_9EURY|nr:Methyltransferase type 12 [Methanosarcina lacustris Z-7289]